MISLSYKNKETGAEFNPKSFGSEYDGPIKQKKIETSKGSIEVIIGGDKNIQNSSSLFKRFSYLLVDIFDPVFESFSERFKSQVHSLQNIQAQMKQKIESILGNDMLLAHKNHAEKTNFATKKVIDNPTLATDTILFLQKRVFELDAHMSSFELIHMGKDIQMDKKIHNFPRVIHNVFSAFEENFNNIGVTFTFSFSEETGSNIDILFDYKTINTALYNIFDNAYKYIKPYTEIRFFIAKNKFIISMRSLKVDKDEKDRIFDLNYRGRNAEHEKGNGIGLYVVKRALELNGMTIEFQPDYTDSESHEGKQYPMNKFIIYLPD